MDPSLQGPEDAAVAKPAGRDSAKKSGRNWAVLRVTSGNFLENYDLTIYGYYAFAIGLAYFPARSEYASLMLALLTFGVGYLVRPLGALVLGSYIDHYGRRPGLLLTVALMGVGTFLVGATPPYVMIGFFAPILVVIARMLQGFSAGGEIGGAAVYLAEIAKPGHKGFYVAWAPASQQMGVIFAASLGYALSVSLGREAMTQWGWRIPVLIGCAIIPVFLWMRRKLDETEVFARQKSHPKMAEVWRLVAANAGVIIAGMLINANGGAMFSFITYYTPTFGRTAVHLTVESSLLVTLFVGISCFCLQPIAGALTDRIGRRPVLITVALLVMTTAYPALLWLTKAPSFGRLVGAELWLAVMFSFYNAATQVFLTEIMPARIRATGFSVANALSSGLIGGFTPAISSWLIHMSNQPALPGLWLSFIAVLAFIGVLLAPRPETN